MEDLVETLNEETQIPTADTAFPEGEAPPLPYTVILDKIKGDGDDFHIRLFGHDLAVEFYAERIDRKNEMKLESFFERRNWKYSRERTWIPSEECFETIYQISYSERV